MESDGVRIETSFIGAFTVVTVVGEIDMLTSPMFERAIAAAPPDASVIVNLAGVDFMDSTGLGVLLRHSMRFAEAGGSLRVDDPSVPVRRLLNATCLDHLIGA